MGVTDASKAQEFFYVVDDSGEHTLGPRPVYVDRKNYRIIPGCYEISAREKKFVLRWPNDGAVWVQIKWRAHKDSEKDFLGKESKVILEEVTTFTPTPEEMMTGVLLLSGDLDERVLLNVLMYHGFSAVVKSVHTTLTEKAVELRPYQTLQESPVDLGE